MYNALDVSKYIINKCTLDSHAISNLQLQKILYYIQVEFLKKYNKAFFNDDIEAWKFGPVIPEVYYRYCGYGGMKIKETYENLELNSTFTDIDKIIESKRILYPWDLVEETHKTKKPWDIVYKDGLGEKNIISKELMLLYG